MSVIGSPIETSLLQAAQAQQTAATRKDRERAKSESTRRREDQVDLRVAGLESDAAVKALPHNDSEEAHEEHEANSDLSKPKDEDRPRIDVVA
ncbi:MAG: hypothetical protein KC983_06025 [Phycisphaerales bacterium]|nr:hypothetical protein [Phycisphaerales bacterium]